MILWSRRLHTCTRQTGTSTRQLQGAGPRSMPWAKRTFVSWGQGHFTFRCFTIYIECTNQLICSLSCNMGRWSPCLKRKGKSCTLLSNVCMCKLIFERNQLISLFFQVFLLVVFLVIFGGCLF